MKNSKIGFIGFGEAGQALAEGLRDSGAGDIVAWDILFPDAAGARLIKEAGRIGVRVARSAEEASRDRDLVISAVTAASSYEAAQSAVPFLDDRTFFLDINSVSPGRKRQTAALLSRGHYVDVAVMAPVHPARHKTPMLLAGGDASALEPLLKSFDMKVSVAGPRVGDAAAIKMVRSVMVKGLEALTYECFVAAARAGVEEQIFASLSGSYPGLDWKKMVPYNLERMTSHGIRRAAELHQVADTLRELGVEPSLSEGAAVHHQALGEWGRDHGEVSERLHALADRLGPRPT
jgi:3-hydroxyisobutyrate dehydrogenase-like beta-hydroxyacid dehydrogenase